MKNSDYHLWIGYHYGQIKRKLTKKEYEEIRTCEFAMHLLVPTDKVLEICGGLNNLKKMDIYRNYAIVKKLAKQFCVTEDVMLFKLSYLIHKDENEEKEGNVKKRIKKRDGKIVFINFD